ncbi:uncharacterized protein EI90DRAFT_3033995 [Cantharellus anzutake]|uniref:uncharacterized protein n=1 Tax=Cantharellus anzutake TaxID=1750568 RepID=UPI00190362C4|nr:uncharacterized protein EI90DRAFT_3033995 [Cantharellus anzutake]KAF8341446.1 hypothetical protein EI90DRAFT_3033995 [Cantharellus anzutake]
MANKCSRSNPHCGFSFKSNFHLRAGILTVSEFGMVSFVLSSALLIYSLRQAYEKYKRRSGTPGSSGEPWIQPISILFLCAIFMDMVHGISNILTIRWALAGEVTEGAYCTTQSVFKQVGGNGLALFTIAIAVLTYLQVIHPDWSDHGGAKIFTAGSIYFIIQFIVTTVTIPAVLIHPYYGNIGMWCWIVEGSKMRIVQYTLMWVSVPILFITYGRVAYKWLRQASFDDDINLRSDAIAMGWYPISYCFIVVPISVICFLQSHALGGQLHPSAPILPAAIYALWGAINVFLWYFTGRHFGFSKVSSSRKNSSSVIIERAGTYH